MHRLLHFLFYLKTLHNLCHSPSGGHGTCLEDEPWTNKLIEAESELTLAGELFNASKQCQYVFGLTSRICPYMVCLGSCFILYASVLFATDILMCCKNGFCHHMVDSTLGRLRSLIRRHNKLTYNSFLSCLLLVIFLLNNHEIIAQILVLYAISLPHWNIFSIIFGLIYYRDVDNFVTQLIFLDEYQQ